MPTLIAGMILRSGNPEKTAQFYRNLGLGSRTHKHGGGPSHTELSPMHRRAVVEIYKKSIDFQEDALMIYVDDLRRTLSKLEKVEVRAKRAIGKTMAYVEDPDGRPILLIESN